MKFWDASALVVLLVDEPATAALIDIYRKDSDVLAWWGSTVECASSIARLEREGDLSAEGASEAFERLASLAAAWNEVQPLDDVREAAVRFLRVHNLRAADALQLAAAFLAAERRPATLEFVCCDERLQSAASREGFKIVAS